MATSGTGFVGMGNMGMDPAEVEYVGRQMQAEANNIGQLLSRVASQVSVADRAWEGQDAKRFVDEWNSRRNQIKAVQDNLSSLGRKALQEASQQRKTSGGF